VNRPTLENPVSRTDRPEERREFEAHDQAGAANAERYHTHLLTILSVSAGMVGVCLTAIGLIAVVKQLSSMEILVDDVLAISAMLFLVASVMSFVGMRSKFSNRWRYFERTLDGVFCAGLVLMAIATLLLTSARVAAIAAFCTVPRGAFVPARQVVQLGRAILISPFDAN
jgi:hypothetical protein